MNDQQLSEAIERLLVARNPRNMQVARAALAPGYFLRAARKLKDLDGHVIIGTGFPVTGTFETDGPVGAIILYKALATLGTTPHLACGPPLSDALCADFDVLTLTARTLEDAEQESSGFLEALSPAAVIAIERPGLAADGRYYNMRGVDITERCYYFDPLMSQAQCATIAIGDGGNECGMGNISAALANLDIQASITCCDELLVADVSNWGAYGLLALLGHWAGRDLLAGITPVETLNYLLTRGSVDGVTGESTLTEDGLEARVGLDIIHELRALVNSAQS